MFFVKNQKQRKEIRGGFYFRREKLIVFYNEKATANNLLWAQLLQNRVCCYSSVSMFIHVCFSYFRFWNLVINFIVGVSFCQGESLQKLILRNGFLLNWKFTSKEKFGFVSDCWSVFPLIEFLFLVVVYCGLFSFSGFNLL
jgi:hypothetical protein